MKEVDIALTVINVLLAILSGVGAYKSVKYFKKNRNLNILAQTNKALIEIQKMLIKLPEALSASSKSRAGKKGFSLQNTLCDIGQELYKSLMEITSNISAEYSEEFGDLQKEGEFDLKNYINSYISGDAIKENVIDSDDYNRCQETLLKMQDYLKKLVIKTEDKLR